MPEATANAIDADGYLHSGDLGMVDEDGYYRVTGRIKDTIIRGGENIYPLEIENFLLGMPGVLDAQKSWVFRREARRNRRCVHSHASGL